MNTHSSRFARVARWQLAVAVLALSATAVAADEERANIEPDAAVQATIGQVADAVDRAQQAANIERLEALGRTSPAELVRQLTYFASRATGTKQAMAPGAILRRVEISDETIARALAPCLASADAELAKSVRNILGGLEKRAPGRRPDFSVYRGIIADQLRVGETAPVALVRYLYDADPGMALLTLMRAHEVRAPEAIKRVLWSEHVVADVLWKQQYGFSTPNEVDPAAAEQLRLLATHEAWWARLYVAEIMRQHAAFRQQDVVDALASDVDATVRESALKARLSASRSAQP